jgi:hypothetical protein
VRHLPVLPLVLLTASLFAVISLAQQLTASRVYSCGELNQAPIPNTTISLAQANPASTNPPAPAHCEIVGKINERVGQNGKPYAIGFRLRLPVDWNGRFFFQGGGGLDGAIGNALGAVGIGQTDNAISRGYAVVSTDAGHTPETAPVIVGAANSGSPWPGQTRPRCPYSKQARYKGGGDVNGAANFTCEAPEQR